MTRQVAVQRPHLLSSLSHTRWSQTAWTRYLILQVSLVFSKGIASFFQPWCCAGVLTTNNTTLTEKSSSDIEEVGSSPLVADSRFRTNVRHAKLLRKIDLRLLPVLCCVHLFVILDRYVINLIVVGVAMRLTQICRLNISNAVLFGLKEDLQLEGDQFNTALVVSWDELSLRPHMRWTRLLQIPSVRCMQRLLEFATQTL